MDDGSVPDDHISRPSNNTFISIHFQYMNPVLNPVIAKKIFERDCLNNAHQEIFNPVCALYLLEYEDSIKPGKYTFSNYIRLRKYFEPISLVPEWLHILHNDAWVSMVYEYLDASTRELVMKLRQGKNDLLKPETSENLLLQHHDLSDEELLPPESSETILNRLNLSISMAESEMIHRIKRHAGLKRIGYGRSEHFQKVFPKLSVNCAELFPGSPSRGSIYVVTETEVFRTELSVEPDDY